MPAIGWGKPPKTRKSKLIGSFTSTTRGGASNTFSGGGGIRGALNSPASGAFSGPKIASAFGSTQTKTPAAPAAAPVQRPWDLAYEQGKGALNLNRDNALAQIAKQRVNVSQLYGLNQDGTENTTDPMSRLAQLKADYQKIKRGSSASYAARGLGYDGAYQNKVNSNYDNDLRSNDALRKDFAAANDALTDREMSVNSSYNTDLASLGMTRTMNAGDAEAESDTPASKPAAATRKDKVLGALRGNLGPAVRKRLTAEARKNGWI